MRPQPLRPHAAPLTSADDAVEISETAARYPELTGSTRLRMELVERLRREIATGHYLTPDKLDVVVERLHEQMLRN